MGKALIQYEPEVMIFDSLTIDNTAPSQRVIVKGHDIHDRHLEHDLMAWVFDSKTVPILNLQALKSGDLLFWHSGDLVPVPFDKEDKNVKVFRKVAK